MIILGADHAGFALKDKLKEYFNNNNIEYIDVTNYSIDNNDDYPDIAKFICNSVNNNNLGIAICGSGIGISIACNKIKGIRAATCYDEYTTVMGKRDNNINVLCLGGRIKYDNVFNIIDIYIKEKFLGDRHLRRLNKINELEENFGNKLC
ncbi:MAG: RpiB/LacA/LacB family sugar-phosphate isomerase [Clostridia bacterium]